MPEIWDDPRSQPERRALSESFWAHQREAMIQEQIEARGVSSRAVIQAMLRVPRHEFVFGEEQAMAYADSALPIGYGQTISQPFIVALMSELLAPGPGSKILEVGTGSGYQAAVLAEMGATVYTIEIVEPLARRTLELLKQLGYEGRILGRIGDAFTGWPEAGPFDGIIMTCAVPNLPGKLLEQLKPGGRVVAPVGESRLYQTLTLATKSAEGEIHSRGITGVVFVPMTGSHGFA